jgi:tetratricopeptide (TPR) repeat protein
MDSSVSTYSPLVDNSTFVDQAKDVNAVMYTNQVGEKRIAPFLAPPQSPYGLVGRDVLLKDLKQRLIGKGDLALSVLNGLPGVGKTAMAVALAYDREVLNHFTDGVLWAGLGRQPDTLAHLGEWCMALGIRQSELEKLNSIKARQQAIHTAIGMQRMLLVVDDAWQVETVLDFKLGGPNCAYLVTTRLLEVALRLAGEELIVVRELDEDDGLKLLATLAPEVTKIEPEEARELVRAVGGLPLALILIGNYLRVQTRGGQNRRLRKALDQMHHAEERLRLEQPQSGLEIHPSLPADTPLSLMAAISVSDEALDKMPRQALRSLAVFPPKPNTFSEQAALAVANVSVEVLDALGDSGLLESNGSGYYMLHQTISDYARVHLTDMTAYERMVRFFVSYVEGHEIDYNAIDQEFNNVSAALRIAAERGMQAALILGANTFFTFLQPRGLYILAEEYLTWAEQAAKSLGDTVGLATTLLNLGETASRQGVYDRAEAYLLEGLNLSQQDEHRKLISALFRNLGEVARDRGDYKQAENLLQQGLILARQIGHPGRISALLASLGSVANLLGNYAQAEEYLRESLAIGREIHHLARISGVSSTLGDVLTQQGDFDQAEAYLQEGLNIARENDHWAIICGLLRNFGALKRDRADYRTAEAYLREGIDIARRIGHLGRLGGLLAYSGAVAIDRGNFEYAEKHLQEGLAIARQIGHREYLSLLLLNLGRLRIAQGEFRAAGAHLEEGLTIAQQIGHRRIVCSLLYSLGGRAYQLGESERAGVYLSEALDLAQQLGHRKLISDILSEQGELYLKQQELNTAFITFREALEMAQGGSQEQIATALYGLAKVAASQGNIIKARQQGQSSLDIFENIGFYKAAEVRRWLSSLYM